MCNPLLSFSVTCNEGRGRFKWGYFSRMDLDGQLKPSLASCRPRQSYVRQTPPPPTTTPRQSSLVLHITHPSTGQHGINAIIGRATHKSLLVVSIQDTCRSHVILNWLLTNYYYQQVWLCNCTISSNVSFHAGTCALGCTLLLEWTFVNDQRSHGKLCLVSSWVLKETFFHPIIVSVFKQIFFRVH